jgi:hypothetical protein
VVCLYCLSISPGDCIILQGLCFAMGRTLVLPPSQPMYLLTKDGHKQKNKFSFDSFFHMEEISKEHVGLDIISMKTFLEREAMTGRIVDHTTGKPSFPPWNRTDWDEADQTDVGILNNWLRTTMHVTLWDPEKCLAVFPKSKDPQNVEDLMQIKRSVDQNGGFKSYEAYVGKPFPVDAPPKDRMMEMWAEREDLCIYDEHMQDEHVIHFPSAHSGPYESRLLVHFYAFLFFQDWKEDLWMKRFMRDHVRYIDEVQCAAARVSRALWEGFQSWCLYVLQKLTLVCCPGPRSFKRFVNEPVYDNLARIQRDFSTHFIFEGVRRSV